MPPKGKPTTVKEYKAALARMDVALPSSTARLSDYERLWEQAQKPPSRTPTRRQSTSPGRGGSSGGRPPTRNTPLSVQTPAAMPATRNTPLSMQSPSASTARRPSPTRNTPLSQQAAKRPHASPGRTRTPPPADYAFSPPPASSPPAASETSGESGCGGALVWAFVCCSLGAVVAAVAASFLLDAPNGEARLALPAPYLMITTPDSLGPLWRLLAALLRLLGGMPAALGAFAAALADHATHACAAAASMSAAEMAVAAGSAAVRSALYCGGVLLRAVLQATAVLLLAAWEHPEKALAALCVIGALRSVGHAHAWYQRQRRARTARREEQVDAAARWVVAFLRRKDAEWRRETGAGRDFSSAEVRRLIPEDALPDAALWSGVVARVRADPCVRHEERGKKETWQWLPST